MPIRFPTEAANDPKGRLDGLPESTGEDDTRRGRAAESRIDRQRGANDARKDEEPPRKDPDKR